MTTSLRAGARRLLSSSSSPTLRRVNLQLDYFMSTQFAGVAVALQNGLYEQFGVDLRVLETCPPGDETVRVLSAYKAEQGALSLGVTEQYVLSPLVCSQGHDVAAIGAMFGRTPLAVASLPGRAGSLSNRECQVRRLSFCFLVRLPAPIPISMSVRVSRSALTLAAPFCAYTCSSS